MYLKKKTKICMTAIKMRRPHRCMEKINIHKTMPGMKRHLLKLQFDGGCKVGGDPLSRFPPDFHGLLDRCDSELDHDGVCVSVNHLSVQN